MDPWFKTGSLKKKGNEKQNHDIKGRDEVISTSVIEDKVQNK
jgi:hypothetical protein